MDLEQFLTRLRATPRDWQVDHFRYLRRYDRRAALPTANALGTATWRYVCQCPVSAPCGLDAGSFELAARRLGLPEGLALRITLAADLNEGRGGYDPHLRRRLLAACGLGEEPHVQHG